MLARELSDVPKQRALRLGIDAEALRTPLSGVGSYVLNLCRELELILTDSEFFAYSRLPASRLSLPSSRWKLRVEPTGLLRRIPSFAWLRTRGARLCQNDQLHVFWATRTLHPRLAAPVRTVCTVHDLNHLIVPDTMQLPTLWSHRAWFRGDVTHAHVVVANSRGTAERVQMLLHRRVAHVVSPAVDPSFRIPDATRRLSHERELRALGVRRPYLLTVSTLEPRKNLAALVDAFVHLKKQGKLDGYQLVLVGTSGWKNRGLEKTLEAAQRFGVVRTGYVARELLPTLYGNAEVFVLPSLYEGFGMPVLEARACGTRVVVSDIPELREAGGAHAIAVEPTIAGISDGILQALRNPSRSECELFEQHSWSRAAQQLAAVFSNVVREDRSDP